MRYSRRSNQLAHLAIACLGKRRKGGTAGIEPADGLSSVKKRQFRVPLQSGKFPNALSEEREIKHRIVRIAIYLTYPPEAAKRFLFLEGGPNAPQRGPKAPTQ